jgi:hypothetical protein
MRVRKTIFGRTKIKPNTFIGGVSAILNTPALVATKLGISVARIKSFNITGSDIEFAVIGGVYSIPLGQTFDGTSLTYFRDIDGLCAEISPNYCFSNTQATEFYFPKVETLSSQGIMQKNALLKKIYAPLLKNVSHSNFQLNPLLVDVNLNSILNCRGADFYNNTSLVNLNLPSLITASYYLVQNCTSLKTFSSSIIRFLDIKNFHNCTSIELIDIPKCIQLGQSPNVNSNQFQGIKTGCVINVNIALQTANAGAPDADLVWVIANRGATVNYIP